MLSALGLLSAQEVERSVVSAWNPVISFPPINKLCGSAWKGGWHSSADPELAVLL